MNIAHRESLTLSFSNKGFDRGMVQETFQPWDETVIRWMEQGLDARLLVDGDLPDIPSSFLFKFKGRPYVPSEHYYHVMEAKLVYDFEQLFGIDPVKRMAFRIPFISFKQRVLEETNDYTLRYDADGWTRKYHKTRDLVEEVKPVVETREDWEALKEQVKNELKTHCTRENAEKIFGPFSEGCRRGDFAIRFRLAGFFWTPRDLFGIGEHMLTFYEDPELLHDINQFVLNTYLEQMDIILDYITPNIILIEEDLSGKTGPMLSPQMFDEFVGHYYETLIPFLKRRGVPHIFVDTDGDFTELIPNFVKAGIDSFLPLDVNAGVDIVEVRKQHPHIKFLGGFNKLCMIEGKKAIDEEFERLMPVIRGGGYLPSTDHQPAPDTPIENYRYYVEKLKQVMEENRGEKALGKWIKE
ncbi:MAG: uroporphyrinogen decarboxylase family protein [Christensenellales bacterium]|jgi:hypothetical protein